MGVMHGMPAVPSMVCPKKTHHEWICVPEYLTDAVAVCFMSIIFKGVFDGKRRDGVKRTQERSGFHKTASSMLKWAIMAAATAGEIPGTFISSSSDASWMSPRRLK